MSGGGRKGKWASIHQKFALWSPPVIDSPFHSPSRPKWVQHSSSLTSPFSAQVSQHTPAISYALPCYFATPLSPTLIAVARSQGSRLNLWELNMALGFLTSLISPPSPSGSCAGCSRVENLPYFLLLETKASSARRLGQAEDP